MTYNHTAYFDQFRFAREGIMKELYHQLMAAEKSDKRLFFDVNEALEVLTKRSHYVYYVVKEELDFFKRYLTYWTKKAFEFLLFLLRFHCDILLPWIADRGYPVSMALPKQSPYRELLRYHTIKIMEDGRFLLVINCDRIFTALCMYTTITIPYFSLKD